MTTVFRKIYLPVLLGDFLAFFIITLIGFLSHQSSLNINRFLVTFLPLCATWLVTAPWFGLLYKGGLSESSFWWRVVWAVILSTPLALFVRALFLNSSIQVTFTLVMISTGIFAILIWRLILFIIFRRKVIKHAQPE